MKIFCEQWVANQQSTLVHRDSRPEQVSSAVPWSSPDIAQIQHLVVQQKDFHQAEVHLRQSLQKSKKIIHKGNNKLLTIIPGSNLAT